MKKINQRIVAVIFVLSFLTACNFEEINTNPFEMTEEMGKRDNVAIGGSITAMQRAVFPVGTQADDTKIINQYQISYNLSADSWSGYFGQNNDWNSSSNNTTYYLLNDWVSATYANSYTKAISSWKTIKLEHERSELPEIFALAQILKVSAWHKTLETFGPIPYTHAGEPMLVIPFDSEEVVFNAMFADLTDAIEVLTPKAEQGVSIASDYDAVYAGDTKKWVQYANSLMLRLAMRISYADEETAKKYASQALNQRFGVMTTIGDEAQMSVGAGLIFRNNIAWLSETYNECRMGSSMFSYLIGYQDPRLAAYFQPSSSEYAYDVFDKSYQAIPPGNGEGQNDVYAEFSKPNIGERTPTYWMRASEIYFLRAEAALRWEGEFGDAEALYKQGVAMSFEENGIKASVDEYLENQEVPIAHNLDADFYSYDASEPTTATTEFTGSLEEKLEKIIIQKWIALYPNGQEAWSEWRRTGYPILNPVQNNYGEQGVSEEGGIRRMIYPTSFSQSKEDKANYEEMLKLLGGADSPTTQLWWDCKNKIY